MALKIGDNFDYQGRQPNFHRDTFDTLSEMKDYPSTSIDEGHISYCSETKTRYMFSSNNTIDPTTGLWRRVVDPALDESSENSIQNKVVTAKFNDLEKSINNSNSNILDKVIENEKSISQVTGDLNEKIGEVESTAAEAINDIRSTMATNTTTINGYEIGSDIVLSKADVGLGNVDNTSDISKPISTATQKALDDKINSAISVTYKDLYNLKETYSLIPGQYYRITDYKCTTIQTNTSSAENKFDIIVKALSSYTLDEEASAAIHEGDNYFLYSNLNEWKIWYCLDNDYLRFPWCGHNYLITWNDGSDASSWNGTSEYRGPVTIHGTLYYKYYNKLMSTRFNAFINKYSGYILFKTQYPTVGNGQVYYIVDNSGNVIEDRASITKVTAATEGCTGVIYRMIDEYGNDCPYDFKNIQFRPYSYDNSMTSSVYTFGEYYDNSLNNKEKERIVNNNIIRPSSIGINYIFIGSTKGTNNFFDIDCSYISLRELNESSNNVFGNSCYNVDCIPGVSMNSKLINNSFGIGFSQNTIKSNKFSYNTFEGTNTNNVFDIDSSKITHNFFSDFSSNTISLSDVSGSKFYCKNLVLKTGSMSTITNAVVKLGVTGTISLSYATNSDHQLIIALDSSSNIVYYYVEDLLKKVDKTTTINGYSLSNNITLTKGDVGLAQVDNTSDLDKPISTATRTEIEKNEKAVSTVIGEIKKTIEENEQVISQTINEINQKVQANEGSTATDLSVINSNISKVNKDLGDRVRIYRISVNTLTADTNINSELESLKHTTIDTDTYNTINSCYSDLESILKLTVADTGSFIFKPLYDIGSDHSSHKFVGIISSKNDSTSNYYPNLSILISDASSITIYTTNSFNVFRNSQNISYADLKSLRDSKGLIPGKKYRITDYNCTTDSENTKSAGHQFDIIVKAIDSGTLSEEASAAKTTGDTYFSSCKLDAWRIWYCLDNDITRFDWAQVSHDYKIYWRESSMLTTATPISEYKGSVVINSTTYYKYYSADFNSGYTNDYTHYILITTQYPAVGNDQACFFMGDNSTLVSKTINVMKIYPAKSDGYGVIYRMIDELENDVPYDFKNIQFIPYSKDSSITYYSYTFNSVSADGGTDNSLNNAEVFGNTIRFYSINSKLSLNFITIAGGAISNYFDTNCRKITFGTNIRENKFGSRCYENVFGNNCNNNELRNLCTGNTFANECFMIKINDHCTNNKFGVNCDCVTLGEYCSGNTFGDSCKSTIIGSDCSNNVFGKEFYSNVVSDVCNNNKFGDVFIKLSNIGCSGVTLSSTTQTTSSLYLKNLNIKRGVTGNVTCSVIGQNYKWVIALDTDGNIIQYPEDRDTLTNSDIDNILT